MAIVPVTVIENLNEQKVFEPSMKLVSRIMKVILEKNFIGKTALAVEINTNYARMARQLKWLEKKSLLESIIIEGEVNVRLSLKGRLFAEQFCNLNDFKDK